MRGYYVGGTMQNYNIMADNQNAAKKIVLDVLDYIRFKIENDRLTMAEVESIARTIEGGLNLSGTIDDLSTFYGQPKNNVKTVICRKLIDKPERRVSYRFDAFRKVVPASWKRKGFK